ncbi:hypothetical protein [Amaricoccus solimangrovi]|uniref:hypothetical protein n=1 Tax=Amaricoccus solimangrovi TaxID=2589815 RepID=UPI0015E29875|nr:hypothetical protein [Amaricoccus solimangrovi]
MGDITVSLPNGATITFPAGTSAETIRQVADQALGRSSAPGGERMRAAGLRSPSPSDANAQALAGIQSSADQNLIGQEPVMARAAKFVQGFPFVGEYLDEAVGAIGGEDRKQHVRDVQAAMDREHPVQSAGLRLGGGLVGAAAAIPAALPAAGGVATALGGGTGALMAAGGIAGAVGGAVEGAVSGYGAGEGDTRGETAMRGGAVGGALGGALGAAGPLLAKGGAALIERLKGTDVKGIAEILGISDDAAKAVKAGLASENPQAAIRRLARGGEDAMLVEAGPATQAMGKAVAASGGDATRIMQTAIDRRMAQGASDVRSALDQAFPATTLPRPKADLQALYDTAYRTPIDYTTGAGQKIEALMSRVPGSYLRKAWGLIEMDPDIPDDIKKQILAKISRVPVDDAAPVAARAGGNPGNLPAVVGNRGNLPGPYGGTPDNLPGAWGGPAFREETTLSELPSTIELDYITRALNDVAKKGDGKGALGGNTNEGRIFGKLAGRIRAAVREANPEYAKALDAAGTEIGIKEAGDFGAMVLRPSTRWQDVEEALHGAPRIERETMKQSVRQSIDDALGNVRRIMSQPGTENGEAIKAVKDLSSRAAREKLALILGKTEADHLAARLDAASTAFELGANLSRNSDTAVRQSVQESIKDSTAPGAVGTLLQGRPLEAVKRLAQLMTGQTPEAQAARQSAVFRDLARALTQVKGQRARIAIDGIDKLLQGQPVKSAEAAKIAGAVVEALGTGAWVTGRNELAVTD